MTTYLISQIDRESTSLRGPIRIMNRDICKISKKHKNIILECGIQCKYRIIPPPNLRRKGIDYAYQINANLKLRTETEAERRLRLWQEAKAKRKHQRNR